ncbi:hypothetical protein [Endozoicomonas sp.]|uniref:hypothetical protein n=1 Tax=Endozoicomonas sp. TaxID=1892382 RepID=UPI00383AD90B
MKSNGITSWVELKKHTPQFEAILNSRRALKKASPWDDMTLFFKEADKHIK